MASSPLSRPLGSFLTASSLQNDTPGTHMLDHLLSGVEDSFASNVSATSMSPRAAAKMLADRERRRQLMQKITLNHNRKHAVSEEASSNSLMQSGDDSVDNSDGSLEWKRVTLLRLRKFLKKKYQLRKSSLVDSASKPGCTPEWVAEEKAQIIQIATDIKSVDQEIQLLSGAKTAVQPGKPAGSDCSKNSAARDDNLSASKDDSSNKSGLSAVKRNLLNIYTDASESRQEDYQSTTILEANEDTEVLVHPEQQPTSPSECSMPQDPLSSGQPRAHNNQEKLNMRTVKRNLLSCYDEVASVRNDLSRVASDASHTTTDSLSVQDTSTAAASNLRFRSDDAAPRRRPLRANFIPDSPTFHPHKNAGTHPERAECWTDVDLSRWATVNNIALSPVVRSGSKAASPIPVVLPHRFIHRRAVPAEHNTSIDHLEDASLGDTPFSGVGWVGDKSLSIAGSSEKGEDEELSLEDRIEVLGEANVTEPHVQQAFRTAQPQYVLIEDTNVEDIQLHRYSPIKQLDLVSGDGTETREQLPTAENIDVPSIVGPVNVNEQLHVPTEDNRIIGSPGSVFDRSVELDTAKADAVLHATVRRILSGPIRSSYDVQLTSRYRGNDPELSAAFAGMDTEELTKAIVQKLPRSVDYEGAALLDFFEEFPLYETIAHPSSELLKYSYVNNSTPEDIPSRPYNKALRFDEDSDGEHDKSSSPSDIAKRLDFRSEDKKGGSPASKSTNDSHAAYVDVSKRLDFGSDEKVVYAAENTAPIRRVCQDVKPPELADVADGTTRSDSEAVSSHDAGRCEDYEEEPSHIEQQHSLVVVEDGADDESMERGSSFNSSDNSHHGPDEMESVSAQDGGSMGADEQPKDIFSRTVLSSEEHPPQIDPEDLQQAKEMVVQIRHKKKTAKSPVKPSRLKPASNAQQPSPHKSIIPFHQLPKRTSPNKALPHTSTPGPTPPRASSDTPPKSPPSSRSRATTKNRPTTPTPHRNVTYRMDSAGRSSANRQTTLTLHRNIPHQPESANDVDMLQVEDVTNRPGERHDELPGEGHADDTERYANLAKERYDDLVGERQFDMVVGTRSLPSGAHANFDRSTTAEYAPERPPAEDDDNAPQTTAYANHMVSSRILSLAEPKKSPDPRPRLEGGTPAANGGHVAVGGGMRIVPPGLNNKTDLMRSIRLARKGTGGLGPVQGPKKVVVQDRVRTLKPLPQPASATDRADSVPAACDPLSLVIGGKRVTAPAVLGAGVVALHQCTAPPKVPAIKPQEASSHILTQDEYQRTYSEEQEDDSAMIAALRQVASERLASYRTKLGVGAHE